MSRFKKLLSYKNPWLLNWWRSSERGYALFLSWLIYVLVSRLFGLNDNYAETYKWISRLMFWGAILLFGREIFKIYFYGQVSVSAELLEKPKAVKLEKSMELLQKVGGLPRWLKRIDVIAIAALLFAFLWRNSLLLLREFYISVYIDLGIPTSVADNLFSIPVVIAFPLLIGSAITHIYHRRFLKKNDFASFLGIAAFFLMVVSERKVAGSVVILVLLLIALSLSIKSLLSETAAGELAEAKTEEAAEEPLQPTKPKLGWRKILLYVFLISAFFSLVGGVVPFLAERLADEELAKPVSEEQGVAIKYVKSEGANIRACRSTDCAIIDTLPQNTKLEFPGDLYDKYADWAEVTFSDGRVGYVSKSRLSETLAAEAPAVKPPTAKEAPKIITSPETAVQSPDLLQGKWEVEYTGLYNEAAGQFGGEADIFNLAEGAKRYFEFSGDQLRICGKDPGQAAITCDEPKIFAVSKDEFIAGGVSFKWAVPETGKLALLMRRPSGDPIFIGLGRSYQSLPSVGAPSVAPIIQPATPQAAPPAESRSITFNSATCRLKEGQAWPAVDIYGRPIPSSMSADIHFTVSGPEKVVLDLTQTFWTPKTIYLPGTGSVLEEATSWEWVPCWAAGSRCAVYQRGEGDPSPIPVTLTSSMNIGSGAALPMKVSSYPISIRLGFQGPLGKDSLVQETLMQKTSYLEVSSCDGSTRNCQCQIVE